MTDLSLAALSAMITPAVLISASGTLILSTSNRLGRAADRVRRFSERTRVLTESAGDRFADQEKAMMKALMPKLMRRVRILHRGLIIFYLAVGLFVLASLLIGFSRLGFAQAENVAVGVGLLGVLVLLVGAAMLTLEAQLSLDVNLAEMEFIVKMSA